MNSLWAAGVSDGKVAYDDDFLDEFLPQNNKGYVFWFSRSKSSLETNNKSVSCRSCVMLAGVQMYCFLSIRSALV